MSRDILLATLIAIFVICAGTFIGWYNNKVVPINTNALATYTLQPGNKLSFMSNWDGPNYIHIATSGYSNEGLTNFFPLYPAAVRVVNWVISSPLDSALLVAWVSFVGVVYFYLKIIKTLFKDTNLQAIRAILLLLFFPTAIFFIATYTESLFGFLALGSIYFALNKKYLKSAIFALFMTATHVTGLLVLLLIGLILWEQKAKLQQIILTVGIGSLGLLSYMLYLEERFKKPLAFISTQEQGHGWVNQHYKNLLVTSDFFSVIFIGLIILAAIYWWSKRKSFSIYSLCYLLIPLVGKQFGGFDRYVLMAFPVPLMLYAILKRRPNAYTFVLILSLIGWSFFMLQYAGGYVGG